MRAKTGQLNSFQKSLRLAQAFIQWRSVGAPRQDLTGKTVLVTGAARGIGEEVTRLLAAWNAHVLLACRDGAQGEKLKGDVLAKIPAARITVLDGADTSDIERMAELAPRVKAVLGGGALDGLVLNAGIAGGRHKLSRQGHESHVATNVLGHHLLANLLLGDLAKSPDGRIVYVTGDIYVLATDCTLDFPYEGQRAISAYARSKLGVSWNARTMQEMIDARGLPVRAVTVHPGVVSSELMKGGDLVKRALLITPEKSAQCIVYALTDGKVRGGDYIHNVRGKMTLPANDPVLQDARRREFWRECNEACKAWLPPS